ncbi:hypothetical protein FDP41_001326 [Naegleria fowleri]|uniref:Uncharacterized protein n=1 Tax=Naegleria fowleri TaxID=5763 RepID=A0A6A5C1A6_NAEFO|nr:uncharacterized protein FDP41_001326 [Naegleria fowleri]KAF0979658.1 hypothetical protein FDP41_001326 [Naegleria fowleri]CAG4711229.1 unnamed protein product [Naegleria fowleri]
MNPSTEKVEGISEVNSKHELETVPLQRERTLEPVIMSEERVDIPAQFDATRRNDPQQERTLRLKDTENTSHLINEMMNNNHVPSLPLECSLFHENSNNLMTPGASLSSEKQLNKPTPTPNSFKERALERQKHINSLAQRIHHLGVAKNGSSSNLTLSPVPIAKPSTTQQPSRPNQSPFDFQTMNKKKEIEKRSYLMSRSFNRLHVEPTPLIRMHAESLRENSRKRFLPSCKQRRMISSTGAASLALKATHQLETILADLELSGSDNERRVIAGTHINEVARNLFETTDPISTTSRTTRNSSMNVVRPEVPEFVLENHVSKDTSVKVIRPGSEEIRFSQWRSVYRKL